MPCRARTAGRQVRMMRRLDGGGDGAGGQTHQDVVRTLLDAGVDRSITDKEGVTALQHAESRGYDEIAALLRD